ncbi:MAG TPA: ACT domain-containing protein [Archaeoglobus profundus]|nr:ACT domain-containing protein [Archaeoglobus profundus]HIP58180.1 ACT domain-containing protein [Archaeoglobus profundus]
MIISIVVELEDKPGQLVKVLEPISKFGGNIISVVHQRDKITPLKRIPVNISFQIDDKKVDALIKAIKERGIVVKVDKVRLTATTTLLLIGHIVHTDVDDTITKIDSTGFAEVVDMHIKMPRLNEPSTAIVTISATNEDNLKKAIDLLKDICKKKNITVIEPLD